MTAFRDMLQRDAERVFTNPNEFGEAATINGVAVQVVISGRKSETAEREDDRPGVVFESAVLNYPTGKLPLPRANREIDWNGDKWMVLSAADNNGLHRLEIYRERS
ncbi:MAG: hypothetical protein LBV79_08225 [Candidatus Adiutrix sp.]|jgi:hypothetical protein|nr:hypothetical protein [Candidatus Adiutrix sp.]